MMKKTAKFFLATIVLVSLLASISGCGKGNSNATPAGQTFTVKRDSFTLEVTAAGNLALSRTEDIPVEFFYPAGTKGTIASVLVEEGDTVKEGQVLVTLDRDEWDEQLKVLRKALDTAKRNVITKTTAVKDAEMELASLKRQVTTKKNAIAAAEYQVKLKELAVKEAELKVQSANETLYKIEQVKKAQDAVEQAQQTLDFVKLIISGIVGGGLQVVDFSYWTGLRTSTQDELEQAQQELEDILAETHVDLTTDVKLQIAQQKLLIEQYQLAVDKASLT
ncbi:MAG: biotin/lipoyl-binding protein [Dehalococcoidales bacterium]|nr:biotin/lipoyl-binding protein [Dehalococcoidales bacterium]